MKYIGWFSAGASSAVAIKIALEQGKCDEIYYIHINDEHPDNKRFIVECEKWFNKKINILKSEKYSCVDDVLKLGYINGPGGASCTKWLKRNVRKEWEKDKQIEDFIYIWGLDVTEKNRVSRIDLASVCDNWYPLIDAVLTKEAVHGIIKQAGIKRPVMYDLGFNNNNCIGCVKGGKGYWNLIRKHFPDVFASRARRERIVGHSCINGVFLDELKDGDGKITEIVEDCGIFCEIKNYIKEAGK